MSTELIVTCSVVIAMVIAIVVLSVALYKQVEQRKQNERQAAEKISTLKQINKDNIASEQAKHSAEEARLSREWEDTVTQTKRECEDKITACRAECDEAIRKTKEYIEYHRETLAQMDEKTLLANVMIALEGYGTRIERLETSLGHEKIMEKIGVLIVSTERKLDQMAGDISRHMEEMDITGKLEDISESISDRLESYDVTGTI